MASLQISGTIQNENGSSPQFALPIKLEVALGHPINLIGPPTGFADSRLTNTDANGAFDETFDIPGTVLQEITATSSPILLVGATLEAQTSDDRVDGVCISLPLTGSETPEEIVSIASQQHPTLTLSLDGLEPYIMRLADAESVQATPILDLFVDTLPSYSVHSVDIHDGHEAKLLLVQGASGSALGGWFRWCGSKIIRSRRLALSDIIAKASTGLILPIPPTAVDIAVVNSQLPEKINEFPLQMRDTYIEIDGGNLLVHVPSISLEVGGFALLNIATVDATITITPKRHFDVLFSDSELDEPFEITVTALHADVPGGTNLDDIPWWVWAVLGFPAADVGALLKMIENIVERMARNQVKLRVVQTIRDQIDNNIDNELNGMAGGDTDLKAELRSSMSLQIVTITPSVTKIQATGVVAIFHPVALCAFNQIAALFPTFHLLPIFRRFQRALKVRELSQWHEGYYAIARKLAGIVKKHPMLGARMGFFAFRAQSLLRSGPISTKEENRSSEPCISEDLITYLQEIITDTSRHASKELKVFLEDISSIVRSAPSRTFSEMIKIVSDTTPRKHPVNKTTR